MGRIVTDGREVPLVSRHKGPPKHTWAYRKMQFDVYGPANIRVVEENVQAITEHFGVSKARAMQLALQLTADAIKGGKLSL